MFSVESAVIASVLYFNTLEGLPFVTHTQNEYCIWVVCSVLKSVDALDVQCTWVVSSVLKMWCTGYESYPGPMFLADCIMFAICKMIFIFCFLFKNQEQFQLVHGHGLRIEVICWPSQVSCITIICDMNRNCNHALVQNCLTVPFLSAWITPFHVCQELDKSLVR